MYRLGEDKMYLDSVPEGPATDQMMLFIRGEELMDLIGRNSEL